MEHHFVIFESTPSSNKGSGITMIMRDFPDKESAEEAKKNWEEAKSYHTNCHSATVMKSGEF
jgi:hypothetical protein